MVLPQRGDEQAVTNYMTTLTKVLLSQKRYRVDITKAHEVVTHHWTKAGSKLRKGEEKQGGLENNYDLFIDNTQDIEATCPLTEDWLNRI